MITAVERTGMTFDSKLTPAVRSKPRDVNLLWLVLDGEITCNGEERAAPIGLAMPEQDFVGANGRRRTKLRSIGEPFAALEIRVRGDRCLERVTKPRWLSLDRGTRDAARTVWQRVLEARKTEAGIGVPALLARLCALGIVDDRLGAMVGEPPSELQRTFWSGVAAAYARLGAAATVKGLGAAAESSLSLRTIERSVASLFADYLLPVGPSWHEMIRQLRLSLAALMLSAEHASVREVALGVGFAHPNALTNALRRAGLPSPTQIRAAHERARMRRLQRSAT